MNNMNIEITLDEAKLVANSVSEKQANKIIKGFFKNISSHSNSEKVKKTTATKVKEAAVKVFEPSKKPEITTEVSQVNSRPKVLPIVDSNKNMTQQPFAQLQNLLVSPSKTIGDHTVKWIGEGVKENEKGEKLYRTHYWCPCGYTGKRYIPTYYKSCKCHDCETHLTVENAVPGEFLKQDKDGAFFVARELHETEGGF